MGDLTLRWDRVGLAALVMGLVAVAYWAADQWVRNDGLPEGLIQVNGYIEGDHITVSSKYAGRVREVLVHEGETVEATQVLLRLDDSQAAARVRQAKYSAEALDAQVEAAYNQLAVLNLEIPLAIEAAEAQVARAQALWERAIAVEKEAKEDAERFRRLAEKDQASLQQRDQAIARWEVARNDVTVALSGLTQAKKELTQAQLGWDRVKAKKQEVIALERQRDHAYAVWDEAKRALDELTITAPARGTITTKMVDVGEMVAAGAPLLELVDLDSLYLKAYVPEVLIGKIRLNLPAMVYTDAFPDQPVEAQVRHIASKAEFTPKEVQTADERVKLVYAVKLRLKENPDHRLTPGLPADAVIRWKEDVAWMKPQ
ncbi:MAG: HlyD family efflux transporter periplasmic adaptor subunit [Nitrospira sp.]|nr:HlyD family efflux transporter periplasmic adaptor subunit [Nitrospira sp.]MCP9464573.1 HlyD family efflux transporter periplasmic adaptor subunit [Nitrospira sp.]